MKISFFNEKKIDKLKIHSKIFVFIFDKVTLNLKFSIRKKYVIT